MTAQRRGKKTHMGKDLKRRCFLGMFVAAWVLLAAETARGASVNEVVIVSKTHFDIGYTARVGDVLERYRTKMMDGALQVMDDTSSLPKAFQFAWTVPGWPLTQIIGPQQTPERRDKILDAMRTGRIVWHALPFTMHTESLDLEDLVRGLNYSSNLSRQLGQPLPTDAKMTDVPSHTWVLPTLLAHAGVKFLHIGCNGASSSPRVPMLFWWEGPDASRLLTFYSAGNYGTDLIPPENWPYKTWLAMLMTGDNQGPPKLEEANALQQKAAEKLPGVNVHFGKLSDFADAILAEHPDLPVVRGDMPDTWIHGLEAMPIETGLARQWRPEIGALERLDTVMRCWGGLTPPSVDDVLARAHENSLLYGEHTWGSNGTKPGPFLYGDEWKKARQDGVYKEFEESFEDHRAYSRNIPKLIELAKRDHMAILAKAVWVSGPRIVVYNPLPWTRNALVSWDQPGFSATAVHTTISDIIEPIAHEGVTHRFVARGLPPMGYMTYVVAEAKADAQDCAADKKKGTIENAFLKVTLDPARGGIRSVVDKRSGRELVNQSSPMLLGQYLYERFDRKQTKEFVEKYSIRPDMPWAWDDFGKVNLPEGDYQSASPKDCSAVYEVNGVMASATLSSAPSGILKDALKLNVRLYRRLPFLELGWTFEKKTGDPWPEAGWICLPINAKSPTFRLGRTGSIMDPAKDVIPGSNRHVFCLNSAMTVTGSGGTVGVCPMDSHLVSLGKPGLWQYSLDYVPNKADIFVNVFNNQWSTNFPLWIEGSWTSRVRLWAAESADDTQALITPGWNARTDCWVGVADGDHGGLLDSQSGLSVSRQGVLVTAFGDNPDGTGRILRLWEQAGTTSDCTVTLPSGFKTDGARYIDLRGQALEGTVRVNGRELTLPLTAYAPCTVLFPEPPEPEPCP